MLVLYYSPQQQKANGYQHGQDVDGPMLRLSEDLPQAVHEGTYPQKPFQQGGQHHHADDGGIHNLCPESVIVGPSDEVRI